MTAFPTLIPRPERRRLDEQMACFERDVAAPLVKQFEMFRPGEKSGHFVGATFHEWCWKQIDHARGLCMSWLHSHSLDVDAGDVHSAVAEIREIGQRHVRHAHHWIDYFRHLVVADDEVIEHEKRELSQYAESSYERWVEEFRDWARGRGEPHRTRKNAASPDAPRPLTETQLLVWEALEGCILPAKGVAKKIEEQHRRSISDESVRGMVKRLKDRGYKVDHRPGRGYFRPDSPPPSGPDDVTAA